MKYWGLNILNVCVYSLGLIILHANRFFSALLCIVICSLSGCTMFLYTTSHTARFFGKQLLNMKFLLFSLHLSETFFILRTRWNIIINVHSPSNTVALFLAYFNKTSIFSTNFLNIITSQFSWTSFQWELRCSVRTDGQTCRHDEANGRFSQFSVRSYEQTRDMHIYIYLYVCLCICTYLFIYVRVNESRPVCLLSGSSVYVPVFVCVCIYIYVYVCVCVYTHTHT